MSELLPCPFCGGEARTWKYSHPTLGEYWRVACDSDLSDCCISGRADTEAEAIAAWNTRAERVGERKTINKTGDFVTHDSRAERTCRIVEYDEAPFPVCSECGAVQPDDYTVYYCWSCGAKVVGE